MGYNLAETNVWESLYKPMSIQGALMRKRTTLLRRFLEAEGDPKEVDKQRHGAFKIIPRITEGSWVVKQAVGQNTPVLLGRKLTTKYFRCAPMTCLHAAN